jgi:hypothetical protein
MFDNQNRRPPEDTNSIPCGREGATAAHLYRTSVLFNVNLLDIAIRQEDIYDDETGRKPQSVMLFTTVGGPKQHCCRSSGKENRGWLRDASVNITFEHRTRCRRSRCQDRSCKTWRDRWVEWVDVWCQPICPCLSVCRLPACLPACCLPAPSVCCLSDKCVRTNAVHLSRCVCLFQLSVASFV